MRSAHWKAAFDACLLGHGLNLYQSAPSKLRMSASYSNSACVRCLTAPPLAAGTAYVTVDTVGAALTVTRALPAPAGRDTFDRLSAAAASPLLARFFTNRLVGTKAGRGMTRGAGAAATDEAGSGAEGAVGADAPPRPRPRPLFHESRAVSGLGSSGSISGGSAWDEVRGGGRAPRKLA